MIAILRIALRHFRGARPGQALIETAMVLPILVLLSLGTFDVGRAIVAHIALTEATQEGSLYAAHEYGGFATDAAAETAVATQITASSDSESVAGATVTTTCSGSPAPGTIVITSTYELPVLSPPGKALFGPSFSLAAQVTATNFHEDGCP